MTPAIESVQVLMLESADREIVQLGRENKRLKLTLRAMRKKGAGA